MIMGFHFALKISDVENLHESDIWFETVDGETCLAIVIRSSKTDQHQHGVRRTLMETGCDLRPVLNAAKWMGRKGWRPDSGNNLFSGKIGKKIAENLRWVARNNHMGEDDFPTHTLFEQDAPRLYTRQEWPPSTSRDGEDGGHPFI